MEKNTYDARIYPFGVTHEEIAIRAYFLSKQAGFPVGRDLEFWFAAENVIKKEIELNFKKTLEELGYIREIASGMSEEELLTLRSI